MSDEDSGATAVNGQIVDAVKTTTGFVYAEHLTPGQGVGTVYANTIAYPKVSQAAAFAVQDATDYLRNIMTISTTTQGVVAKLMVEHYEQALLYAPILEQMQTAVTAAQQNFEKVGESAAKIMAEFGKAQ
jgi:flavin-binding protein dodecin